MVDGKKTLKEVWKHKRIKKHEVLKNVNEWIKKNA